MTECYIGLGSNLADPERQLNDALRQLDALSQIQVVDVSSFYLTAPVGPQDQPDYLNAVARIATTLTPVALLDALQDVENRAGRVRTRRWGPRTLDLDLLTCGDLMYHDERLTVPHPRLHERPFVLIPLHEVAPDLVLPDGSTVSALKERCNTQGVCYHGPADWRVSR